MKPRSLFLPVVLLAACIPGAAIAESIDISTGNDGTRGIESSFSVGMPLYQDWYGVSGSVGALIHPGGPGVKAPFRDIRIGLGGLYSGARKDPASVVGTGGYVEGGYQWVLPLKQGTSIRFAPSLRVGGAGLTLRNRNVNASD